MAFIPKNWLREETDSISKRFPVSLIDSENNEMNTIQLLKQCIKEFSNINDKIAAIGTEDGSLEASILDQVDAAVGIINSRIDAMNFNMQNYSAMFPELEGRVEALENRIWLTIDDIENYDFGTLKSAIFGNYPWLEIRCDYDDINNPTEIKGILFKTITSQEWSDIGGITPYISGFNFKGGPINADEEINSKKDITAEGDLFGTNLHLEDSGYIEGSLNVQNLTETENLEVHDQANLHDLNVSDNSVLNNVTINGPLVANDTALLNSLNVTNTADIKGNLNADANLNVNGNTMLVGNSNIIQHSLNIWEDLRVGGTITTVSYSSIDLALAGIEQDVTDLKDRLEIPPIPDNVNNYVLKSLAGILTWEPE